jgi:hypothetical protein
MRRQANIWFLLIGGLLFIFFISAPFIFADQASGSEYHFGGFLLNPIDGNSYLAKMYQGSLGTWKFKFPYTAEQGDGAYIFLYYLGLGKLAEFLGLSMQFTFHAARFAGAILMLLALWNFFTSILDSTRSKWLAFSLAIFGSGLGWLAALFGAFTADFWVAEGFPFLAAYANPHFPLGLAILVYLLTPAGMSEKDEPGELQFPPGPVIAVGSLLLAFLLPFGVIIAGSVYAVLAVWQSWTRVNASRGPVKNIKHIISELLDNGTLRKLIWLLAGGLPVITYEIWLTRFNPLFNEWNSQNLTASPPLWDLLLSYGPLLLFAVPGGWFALRTKKSAVRILIVWALVSALLIYFPWGLQRRFLLGFAIPLAGLAGIGLDAVFRRRKIYGTAVLSLLLILVIPTNMMVILGGLQAVQSRDRRIFISAEELKGMEWIASHTDQDALILAGPETGTLIPAYSGRTVFYGHPFETAHAADMESAVTHFYDGTIDDYELSMLENADYIFYGPREASLGTINLDPNYKLVYSSGKLKIYQNLTQPANLNRDVGITDS